MSGQAMWTVMALAWRSGQELHNSYTVTGSPDFSPLRRFFVAAVAELLSRYDAMTSQECVLLMPPARLPMPPARSLIESMREEN